MPSDPQYAVIHVKVAMARYRGRYGHEPRQVLVGLMHMAALEQRLGRRSPGEPLQIHGVPIAVGGLDDVTLRCVA